METVKVRTKKFTYYIGIDISKNELDYAVMHDKKLLFHEEGINDPDGIQSFILKLKSQSGFTVSKALFCMEHTGFYCNHLLNALKKIKANVVLENPLHLKKSLGVLRGKDDKTDSIRIAGYAQKNKDELILWTPPRQVILELKNLFALRNRLLGLLLAINTPLKEETTFIKKGIQIQNKLSCERSINGLRADLASVDLKIQVLLNSDAHLSRLKELITSVPHIGLITAIQIIISTNEFKDINSPKKFACYAGVAPFKKESGLLTGKARVSHYANKKIKSLLHICALSALSRDAELKAYYLRKTQTEGKPKLAVVNAIRNKLILRVFACVNQDRAFVANFVRPGE